MPAICEEYIPILTVITGLAGIVAAIVPIVLAPNIIYTIRWWFKRHKAGRKPPPQSRWLWAILYISFTIGVLGTLVINEMPRVSCKKVIISDLVCNPVGEDVAGEVVTIRNDSWRRIDLENWTICDSGDHYCYIFGPIGIDSRAEIKLWTKSGTDTASDLYWNKTKSIWNDTGDAARLLDEKNIMVSEFPCPE